MTQAYRHQSHHVQVMEMPRLSQVLAVQFQGDQLCFWAMVETTAALDTYGFAIVGTGNPADHAAAGGYLATVQQPGTPLVWHVFLLPPFGVRAPVRSGTQTHEEP